MPTSGSFQPPRPTPVVGQAVVATFNLQPLTVNVWHDTPFTITLPEAGTYRVGGALRGNVTQLASDTIVGIAVFTQFVDVTAGGVIVPESFRTLAGATKPNQNIGTGNFGVQATSPVDFHYTIPEPRTLRLQGRRGGSTNVASILGGPNSGSLVTYEKVA
ncbi:hypothetical protein [Nonomuraea recticatena]|uniref:Uncharacterized protein n=1 Tax=Nonomuraea recticatena TaxID=46178 RepID=A0ABN3T9D6_9ACTN